MANLPARPAEIIQGSLVALAVDPDGPLAGVLLRGPSGTGKSDLALRLIEACPWRRTRLVADDGVSLQEEAGRLIALCPPAIAGVLEVRGVGLVQRPFAPAITLRLLLALGDTPRRLPQLARERLVSSSAIALPVLPFNPFELSAPEKVRMAVRDILDPASEKRNLLHRSE